MSKRTKILIVSAILIVFTCVGSVGIWFVFNAHKFFTIQDIVSEGPSTNAKPEKLADWNDFDSELLTFGGDRSAIEPVELEYILVILPLTNEEGLVDEFGGKIASTCYRPWQFYLPRHIGIPDPERVDNAMRMRSSYRPDSLYEYVTSERNEELKILGATHVVSGSYEKLDDIISISLNIEAPTEIISASFEFPEEEIYRGAAEINQWVIENTDFRINENVIDQFTTPFYGDIYTNDLCDVAMKMYVDAEDPIWSELKNSYPDKVSQIDEFQLRVAKTLKNGHFVRDHPPEIIAQPQNPIDIIARLRYFSHREMWAEFFQESETFLTMWPGHQSFASEIVFDLPPDDWKRKEYITLLESWSQKTNDNVMAKAWLASEYFNVGWNYRGTKYYSRTPTEDMQRFYDYSTKGGDLFFEIQKDHDLTPWMAKDFIGIIGSIEYRQLDFAQLTVDVATKFPRDKSTLDQALNYLRPRWGGSDASAKYLYDQCVRANPENPLLAMELIYYYYEESSLRLNVDKSYYTNLKNLREQNPTIEQHLYEALENVKNTNQGFNTDTAVLASLVMIRDWDEFIRYYREHPGHYIENYGYYDADWRTEIVSWMMHAQFETGDIDNLQKTYNAALELDNWAYANQKHSSNRGFCCTPSKNMWSAVLRIENGDRDALSEVPTFFQVHSGKSNYFYYSAAMGEIDDLFITRVDRIGESSPSYFERREPYYFKSIAYYQMGDKAKAKELFEQAQDKKLNFVKLEEMAKIIVEEEKEFSLWDKSED